MDGAQLGLVGGQTTWIHSKSPLFPIVKWIAWALDLHVQF